MKETITVPREQAATVEQLFALLRSGKLAQSPQNLSHTSRKVQVYGMHEIRKRFAKRQGMGFGQPDLSDVHTNVPMTNISIAYRNPMYIGRLAVPTVPVVKESDNYYIFDRGSWLRDEAKVTGPGDRSPRGGYTISDDNYSVKERSFEMPVPDRIRNNSDSVLGPDRNAINMASDKIELAYEKSAKSLLFTGANWGTATTLVGPDQWSDPDSTPIMDASTARQAVLLGCGFPANTCVMGYAVYETLALHGDLLNRIKYTGTSERPSMVTPMMIAALFEVDNLLIGKGIENTGVEGGTDAFSHIWGDKVWFGHVASAPALETPSAAYVFSTGRSTDMYREPQSRSDIHRCFEAWDAKKTAAGAGFLYEDVLA